MATNTTATPTNTQQFVATNGRMHATFVFPGAKTPELDKIRAAWANLMDTGRKAEADALYAAIYSDAAGAVDQASAIEAGLAEIDSIERHGRKIVDVETQRRFEAHVNACAKNLYPRGGRVGQIFIETALHVGFGGNDPIGQAMQAAHEYLHPSKPTPRVGRTEATRAKAPARRHRQLERAAQHQKGATSGKK